MDQSKPNQDSAPVAGEQTGLPIPPVSKPSEGQPSSGGGSDVAALLKRMDDLEGQIKQGLREAQSFKDKRLRHVDELEAEVAEIKAQLGKGKEPDEIAERMAVRQLLAQERPVAQPDPGRSDDGDWDERARKVLDAAGVKDEAERREICRKCFDANKQGFRSNDEALSALTATTIAHQSAKLQRNAPVSPAAAISPAGGTLPQQDLKAEYIKEAIAARGNPAQGKALREKYRKLGFNPGSVDLRM